MKRHGWRLRAWRFLWSHAVHHGWPEPLMLAIERRFLDAGKREALRQATAEFRQQTEAWSCLAGEGPTAQAGDGLHDDTVYPSSRQRKVWEA